MRIHRSPTRRVPDGFGFDWIVANAQSLAVEVPVRPAEGRCVYVASDAPAHLGAASRARARSLIESKLLFRSDPLSPFPSVREFETKVTTGRKLLADLYFCHGGVSQGSGRTVLERGYQLKGVGRTQLAGVHGYYGDASGSATLFAALLETANALLLRRILTSGALRCDFVCVLGRPAERTAEGDVRSILGRRGSPVRLTHLEYLRGSLLRHGRDSRRARWLLIARQLLGQVASFPHRFGPADLVRAGHALLDRALVLTAECRLFGLQIPFWADNYDLFARAFDVGDTDCHFPRILLTSELRRPSPRSCSPMRFFSALYVMPMESASFDFSLYPVRNALAALEILYTGIGLELDAVDRVFTWERLEQAYDSATAHVLARAPRLLGLGPHASVRRRALELPLLHRGRSPTHELSAEDLFDRPPGGLLRSIGYGKLNAHRKRLRDRVAVTLGRLALRGRPLPLWDEGDLLDL